MQGKWVSVAILSGVVASIFSISLSEVFFGLALLLWLFDCWKLRTLRLKSPPFGPFLLAFFAFILVSIVFSGDVLASASYLKKFVKFLYVFLIFTYVSRDQVEITLKAIFIVLGASSMFGLLQYFWMMDINLLNRIEGFMGHWMTFSGQLMMGAVALFAYILVYKLPQLVEPSEGVERENFCERRKRSSFDWNLLETLGWTVILGLLLFTLVLTYTRNAWLGTVGGFLVLLWIYRSRWLIWGIMLLVVVFLALPGAFKSRVFSGFDPDDTTTRIRLELLLTGLNIVAAHPWTGLGPNMVPRLYQDYNGTDEFPSSIYQHLHNNPLHIAAEMGALTLLVWLGLWVRLFWDFALFTRNGLRSTFSLYSAIAGISVLVAFLIAGFFEYNFGDSEILILLLFFVTTPYVVQLEQEQVT